MKTEIQKLAILTKFLQIKHSSKTKAVIHLEKPTKILLQNIYLSWLKLINTKSTQNFPVYLNKETALKCQNVCYGYIQAQLIDVDDILIEHSHEVFQPKSSVELSFSLVAPQQDVIQYFIQWQRYRKYWWSSITTTPSLFSINDMQHGAEGAAVSIAANFTWAPHIVEIISIDTHSSDTKTNNSSAKASSLTCAMGLEAAGLTLLLDGVSNATKEEYLKLHNRMAPYKVSFALDSQDEKTLSTLKELATLIFHRLSAKEISGWLPTFTLPLQLQIKENLHLGVTYTAILSESTLSNGIFHLLNSNTMLKEQVHVADFDSYAALLCEKR